MQLIPPSSISEYTPARDNSVGIVIDVIRASSTIVTLLDKGCHRVYTLAEEKPTLELAKRRGCSPAGNGRGIKLKGFDMENSPAEVLDFPEGKGSSLVYQQWHQGNRNRPGLFGAIYRVPAECGQACVRAALVTAQPPNPRSPWYVPDSTGVLCLMMLIAPNTCCGKWRYKPKRLGIGLCVY